MKKTYLTLITLFITVLSFGQGTGDFIITGYNGDAPEGISFITVVDIPASSSFSITDNGWLATNEFRSGEGIKTWTSPGGVISAGTEISIDFSGNTASQGTVANVSGSIALSGSGDQIFIYDAANIPGGGDESGFIAAIQMNGAWDTGSAASSNNSERPSVFVDGTSSLFFASEVDNGTYNCTIGVTPQTAAALRASIYNEANWFTSQTVPQTFLTCGLVLPVQRNEIENFTVYPNPVVDGRLTINTMSNAAKAIQIFDVLGKQVFTTEIQQNGAINVESLKTGIYILKVVEEGKTSTSRLLIE